MSEVNQLIRPASVDEVSAAVADAVSGGYRLLLNRDCLESGTDRRLSLDQMQASVDYPARDMTITVQAGMSFLTLQEILRTENQQLPIDCCDPDMSIGAIVASDLAGPRQFGYGPLRDYVIGIEAVDGQGRVFHAGGRVVKNVAGYDLCRLMVGSRGALGIITMVTFKLKPLPEHARRQTFCFDSVNDLELSLDRLNTTSATPVVLDFKCNSAACAMPRSEAVGSNSFPVSLTIGVEGSEESCEWQFGQLRIDCNRATKAVDDAAVDDFSWNSERNGRGNDVVLRVLPSQVAPIAAALARAGLDSYGHAGNGILLISGGTDSERVRMLCEEMTKDRTAFVLQWDVDHPAKNGGSLSARLRDTFDPHGIFVS